MTLDNLIEKNIFDIVLKGNELDKVVTKSFCCDILSIAMSKAPAGAAWVTVMGNINTLSVATLTDAACIILARGVVMDEIALAQAEKEGITVLNAELPIF